MMQAINRHIDAAFHHSITPPPPSHRGNGWVKPIQAVGAGAARGKEAGGTVRNEPSWVFSKMERAESQEWLGCVKWQVRMGTHHRDQDLLSKRAEATGS